MVPPRGSRPFLLTGGRAPDLERGNQVAVLARSHRWGVKGQTGGGLLAPRLPARAYGASGMVFDILLALKGGDSNYATWKVGS
jgi:hypothetical protein